MLHEIHRKPCRKTKLQIIKSKKWTTNRREEKKNAGKQFKFPAKIPIIILWLSRDAKKEAGEGETARRTYFTTAECFAWMTNEQTATATQMQQVKASRIKGREAGRVEGGEGVRRGEQRTCHAKRCDHMSISAHMHRECSRAAAEQV